MGPRGPDAVPRARKAKASLQDGASGNELSEVKAAYLVVIVAPPIVPLYRSASPRLSRFARQLIAPACARIAQDERTIGKWLAARGAQVDRAARPERRCAGSTTDGIAGSLAGASACNALIAFTSRLR